MRNANGATRWLVIACVIGGVIAGTPAAASAATESLVTVGSPPSPFPQNKQNEPGLAIDPIESERRRGRRKR